MFGLPAKCTLLDAPNGVIGQIQIPGDDEAILCDYEDDDGGDDDEDSIDGDNDDDDNDDYEDDNVYLS